MSVLMNAAFYAMTNKLTQKDTYNDLSGTLSNLVGGQFSGNDPMMSDLLSETNEHSDILYGIRDDGRKHNDNLIDSFRGDFNDLYEAAEESSNNIIDGMRMSTLKVDIVNAELDIVDPLSLSFRDMFVGLREDNLMYQHENSLWFERIVQGLERLDRTTEDSGVGIVLAYRQFMRHPVWFTLSAIGNLVIDLGKMVSSAGFALLFGFGKKKTVQDKILDETKKQTEFMLTGEIDQTKTTWEQFKSGGVAGLIGRSIGEDLGITQTEAQKRADARLQGEEVAGGLKGWLTDKVFGSEIVKRERIEQDKEEQSKCCLNTNNLLKDMRRADEKFTEEQLEWLASIGENTEDTAKESKKTNRHLFMSKIMGLLGSIGGLFKGLGGVGGILKKGLGAGLIFGGLKAGIENLKSGEGMGISSMFATTVGGLLVGGIKGLAVGGAFSVGTAIGTFLNDNVINPFSEWLTGEKGATLGSMIYDFFHDTESAATRSEAQIEKGTALMGESQSNRPEFMGEFTREDYERKKKAYDEAGMFARTFDGDILNPLQLKEYKNQLDTAEKLKRVQEEKAAKETLAKKEQEAVNEVSMVQKAKETAVKAGGVAKDVVVSGAIATKDLAVKGYNSVSNNTTPALASEIAQQEYNTNHGLSSNPQYTNPQRAADEREVQEAIARQRQNVAMASPSSSPDGYSEVYGVDYGRPSIDTSTVKPSAPISIDPMIAEQAAMNRKMDRMIKQLEEANKAKQDGAPYDPYPDSKTILNTAGGW